MEYYNKQGERITMEEFGRLHNGPYKFVMKDEVGGWQISTVWLGIDHNFGDDGEPLIFETMIFEPDDAGNIDDVYCERYSTEDEAKLGHVKAMKWLLEKFDNGR